MYGLCVGVYGVVWEVYGMIVPAAEGGRLFFYLNRGILENW